MIATLPLLLVAVVCFKRRRDVLRRAALGVAASRMPVGESAQ